MGQCEPRIVLRLGGCSTVSRGTVSKQWHTASPNVCSAIILVFLPYSVILCGREQYSVLLWTFR